MPPELAGIPSGELRELIAACLAKAATDRPAPQAVAQALGGALGASGWLPAPLVEEASRAAVALLDLEADPAAGVAAESPSGPVPFTASSYGGPAGGYGAPDPSYGSAEPADAAGAGTAYGPYGPPPQTGRARTGAPPRPPAACRGPGPGPRGRRQSGRTPVQLQRRDRGRRRGGGAVRRAVRDGAAARPGGGRKDLADGTKPSDSASAPATRPTGTASGSATPSAPASPKGTRNDVPEELTGTWKGTVTTARMGVATEFEITIKPGRVGETVARDKSVLPIIGTDCSGDWKLASATDRSLVLDTSGGPNPAPGICSNGSADERFTLNETGTLHYKSGDAPAGNPEGDLTRIP